jgi:dihydroflavonol-4-reductase
LTIDGLSLTMPSMRIGVTGAFGFLGANFVAHLLAQEPPPDVIVAFYSRVRENPLFDPERTARFALDVRDPGDVLRKTEGLDVLVHFAGSVSYSRRRNRDVWDTNVLGARNVFEATLANGIRRLLYVSSINVLGACRTGTRIADESNDVYAPDAGNPNSFLRAQEALAAVRSSARGDYSFLRKVRVAYFDSKLAGYELAQEYHRTRGLPVVVVLPGTAVGAGDLHYEISELIDRVYSNRLAATFPGGTSFVDAADFARGAALALEKGADGQSYIISGPDEDNLSYRQFMRRAAATARGGGRRVRTDFAVVPRWLALPAAAVMEGLLPGSSLTTALVRAGAMTHRFTSRKAVVQLGYSPARRLEQSIAECHGFLESCESRQT